MIMSSSLKKISILVILLVVSYLLSTYVGNLYDSVSFQDGGLAGGRGQAISFAGFVISYIFLVPFAYGLFGITQNKKLIFWLLLPAVLLVLSADKAHFYIPLGLVLAGLATSWTLRQVWLRVGR